MLVCWDQWFPEGARLTALRGANTLFYPTAIGWHPAEKDEYGEAQHDAWKTIQRSHAIANGVYVAVANRVGMEHGDIRGNRAPGEGLEFWGGSFIADPFGRMLAEASHDKEEILTAEVDLAMLEEQRRHWPFLRDRRVDAYAGLTERFLDDNRMKYRMPAEWEPHQATWIAWPHNEEDWPGKFGPIPWVYADIVRCLSVGERVEILVNNAHAETAARSLLERSGARMENVRFHSWPTDRVWLRDSGPIFVRDTETSSLTVTDWRFNAWAKYENWQNDD